MAECSVCQFVKSNCLIGFDQEGATVGLLPNWEIQNGFFTQFSDWKYKEQYIEEKNSKNTIQNAMKNTKELLEFCDNAHRLGCISVAADAPWE